MSFKVIKGGSSKNLKKGDAANKINVFVQHMRSIEQSMSMVLRMAESLEWAELTRRTIRNHHDIRDTLSYVKHYYKDIIIEIEKKHKVPQLSLAVDNAEGDKDETKGDF